MADKYEEPDKIRQYVAALEANLEKATGKPLSHWVKIAKACPHAKTSERLKWFKSEHGLGMSRAGLVLWRAFGTGMMGDDDPAGLVDALFAKSFAEQRPIYEEVAKYLAKLGKGTLSPRRSYVALYRLKQYGAIKPSRQGLLIGLALKKYPKNVGLVEVKNFGGGDRNRMALVVSCVKDFNATARQLLKDAYSEA